MKLRDSWVKLADTLFNGLFAGINVLLLISATNYVLDILFMICI